MEKLNLKKFSPVPFTNVSIKDSFWSPKLEVNRKTTIPTEYQQCKETGRIDAFKLDWKPGQGEQPHIFWDSDVAKWIEAASYSLMTHPDSDLEGLLDHVIELISSAQQPDGYLNVYFTSIKPEKRWTDLRDAHELYCAGHLMEAAVAHFQATGKRSFLDTMCRYADYIDSVFGTEPGKKRGYCGHEEIELALVKLYRITGNERYLKLSEYFVEERGQQPHYFEMEAAARPEGESSFFGSFMSHIKDMHEYNQSHKPVREQDRVTGHAVRAMYLYCAMADLAGELGDESLVRACERLWEHLVLKNMYITGGIGQTRSNEGFTFDYDFPNETAYNETCAAVGLVFWNHRLLQLNCDSKYADVMERALYNGVISGISLDGKKFFYDNPLASLGDFHRQEWFGCACCPPNIARLLASLGEYIYSQNDSEAAVHLYVSGSSTLQIKGKNITIHQQTNYPWDGNVKFSFDFEGAVNFGLKLRLPGWCKYATLKVNDQVVSIEDKLDKGYIQLEREWKSSDVVELELAMPVERVHSHPAVRQNIGCTALQRGPIVYCLEEMDNQSSPFKIFLPRTSQLHSTFDETLLKGVMKINGEALTIEEEDWVNTLYRSDDYQYKKITIQAVPYYAWDNREPGKMAVWINELR
ncbi:glycoside hydrolase family 127 protein [Neobacillus cucumis]|uniref:Glycoside hydrolase family 127 protein n=1 Tax=Neobacillus cucumis TaxID=1740721 RepID=A0A2N5H6A1_9BACI|nr:beta-L-arabinofuranosidase domain-containing protein [Neobacillus cucumis]PLS01053.1 hypothetical protein CVD27_27050 [Neobacillus cucumis]